MSTASVSRAFSGAASVTPELQVRIRSAAARLGYVPNLAARTLATRHSRLIGIVVDSAGDAFLADIIMACERALAASGYGIVCGFADADRALAATQAMVGRGAEAIVFAGIAVPPEAQQLTAKHGSPCLQLSHASAADGIVGVSVGRLEGLLLAARYLQSLGHKSLGAVASSADDAADALRQALGTSVSLEVASAAHDPAAARSAVHRWLAREPPPTAIICDSDAFALAALRECVIRKVSVPETLSLIGFGDAPFTRSCCPALSTIRIHAADLGIRLAEVLRASIEGRIVSPLAPPLKLVARESTGPPPVNRITSFADVPRET